MIVNRRSALECLACQRKPKSGDVSGRSPRVAFHVKHIAAGPMMQGNELVVLGREPVVLGRLCRSTVLVSSAVQRPG